MKRLICFALTIITIAFNAKANYVNNVYGDSLFSKVALEPFLYREDFEKRMLGAWASYPHWQDIAFDHFLKTNKYVESYKVRFAAGDFGKLDVTIPSPPTNQWVSGSISFEDVARQNPVIAGMDRVKVYALAFLAKIPNADPEMPIFLAIDDITVKAAQAVAFRFVVPSVEKLPEYDTYISRTTYQKGAQFRLSGRWPLQANRVTIEIAPFTEQNKSIYKADLENKSDNWQIKSFALGFPVGLYIAKLTAWDGRQKLSETSFTIHIKPQDLAGRHPRLIFDADGKKRIQEKFHGVKYKELYDGLVTDAAEQRKKVPVKSLIFDLDQFPDENWLPTWAAWGSHIYNTGEALRSNSRAYAFHGDKEAGNYVKDVLVTLSSWPNWTHPWQTKRGRFSEHRTGSWAHRVAEAYDLVYDVMTPDERKLVRSAILKNIIEGAHKTYVVDDNITGATSNWIAMAVGGSLMNIAAIYDDGPETENMETYFVGAMFKYYKFLNRVIDSKDGAWGEGYGYNNYSLSNLSFSLPALKNVFNVDAAAPIVSSYNEFIWGGLIKSKTWFEYGDSGGDIGPATNWAYLLQYTKNPRLAWFYQYCKKKETYEDVLYDLDKIPQDDPFDENPVKIFREVGTTVFKSGWDSTDMSFVMRTGAFFNHQHIDQGSFWFADKGKIFIEERHLHNSNYYDDPIYQSWLIQPVAHSTILVNGNHQSQRVGDHLKFAAGFDDHAFIAQSLDGRLASFSSGDIGRLYWGKVASLKRNVLFLKPRTLLMLDVAEPAAKDAAISLLYQTKELKNIKAGQKLSTITIDGETLNIQHLSPSLIEAKAVETPHYLKTLLNDRPLIKEGMLMVTAHTTGNPLVMANVLSTEPVSGMQTQQHDGFMSGQASGKNFMFSTAPGKLYEFENMRTDALCVVWKGDDVFVSLATNFSDNGKLALSSDLPVSFEISKNGILHYAAGKATELIVGATGRPKSVLLNNIAVKNYKFNNNQVQVSVPEGEGEIKIVY